jgi:MSHA biogenesis protein MshP
MMRRQRGLSLVAAIFLIVIIAMLSTFAVTVASATHETTGEQLLMDRARAAAKAGLEWGVYRARVQNFCPAGLQPPLPLNQGGLRGFRVTVTCVRNGNVIDITATAQHGNFGQADYASRTLVRRFN